MVRVKSEIQNPHELVMDVLLRASVGVVIGLLVVKVFKNRVDFIASYPISPLFLCCNSR